MKFATRKQPNNEYKTQSIHRTRSNSQQVEFIVTRMSEWAGERVSEWVSERMSERTNDQMIMMNVMPLANINTEFIKMPTNDTEKKRRNKSWLKHNPNVYTRFDARSFIWESLFIYRDLLIISDVITRAIHTIQCYLYNSYSMPCQTHLHRRTHLQRETQSRDK